MNLIYDFLINLQPHLLILHHSNSAWWSLSRSASSSAGVEADAPCLSQLCPPPPPGPHCHSLPAHPVPYLSHRFVYPWDTPRCRSWRSPPHASPWTHRARRRSGHCTGPLGGASASRSSSGCCSRRSMGCSPVRASAGSRGPPARRTGSCGGCCWTGRAHGGTAGPRMQLQGKNKFLLLEFASCGLHFFECSTSQTTCDQVQLDIQDKVTLSSNLATSLNFLLTPKRSWSTWRKPFNTKETCKLHTCTLILSTFG